MSDVRIVTSVRSFAEIERERDALAKQWRDIGARAGDDQLLSRIRRTQRLHNNGIGSLDTDALLLRLEQVRGVPSLPPRL